jgi:hypothetical protein
MDADAFRHLGDGTARIEDEANGLILVLLGEVSACRHAMPSAAISGSLRPGVYKIGNGPVRRTRRGQTHRGPPRLVDPQVRAHHTPLPHRQIRAGQHLLTAEDPLPDDLRDALTLITAPEDVH